MSRIVFFNIPASGHTNPTLGIVQELTRRGHEVWYFSYEAFRKEIEEAGAIFIACDPHDHTKKPTLEQINSFGQDLAFSVKHLVDTTLSLDSFISEEIKKIKPDSIVADSMALWGKMAALKFHIPFISSTTTFAFNKKSAEILKQGKLETIKNLFSFFKASKEIKKLKRRGFPIKSVLDILQNDDNTDTICFTSPEFQPYSESFSDHYHFIGPGIRPIREDFKKERDTLIYISMGTVLNNQNRFFKNCVQALKDTNYQVIISAGNYADLSQFEPLPKNITIKRNVDQIAVLNKADLFITHCGMNSVNEALYFGVPIIMFPQTTEQKGVAKRVLDLGAGEILENIETKTILNTVEKVLKNSFYKRQAEKISEGFKQCPGVKGAAEIILSK